MKNILFLFFFFIFSFLCQGFFYNDEVCDVNRYKVYKIDSINNYYIIYALNELDYYKIISKKDSLNESHNIRVGEKYNFQLINSIIENNYLDVKGIVLDDTTLIEIEPDSILFLSYPQNVSGLYINTD